MKQGKKLLREHKNYLTSKGLDPSNYLLERRGTDEEGYRWIQVINLETNKTERYYM